MNAKSSGLVLKKRKKRWKVKKGTGRDETMDGVQLCQSRLGLIVMGLKYSTDQLYTLNTLHSKKQSAGLVQGSHSFTVPRLQQRG